MFTCIVTFCLPFSDCHHPSRRFGGSLVTIYFGKWLSLYPSDLSSTLIVDSHSKHFASSSKKLKMHYSILPFNPHVDVAESLFSRPTNRSPVAGKHPPR